MRNRMENTRKSEKILYCGLLFLVICSIIPLLWIARYNVMALDDYSNGVFSHRIWLETGSLFEFLKVALQTTKEDYFTWQGSFTYNFLCHIYPAYIDERYVWITPILMIVSLVFSLRYLYLCFVERFCTKKVIYADIVFLLFILGMIQELPSPMEGYFWYCGAVGYTFLHAFYFVLVGRFIRAEDADKVTVVKGSFISLGAFLLGGSHYITALECMVFFIVYLGISILDRKKVSWWKGLAIGLFFIGFIIQLLASGNTVRQGVSSGMSAVDAIMQSFLYAIQFGYDWLSWLKIIVFALVTPWIWKSLEYSNIRFDIKKGLLLFLLSFCVYASCFTAPLYGVGNVNAGRARNLIYIMLYVISFIDYYYLLGLIRQKSSRLTLGITRWRILYTAMVLVGALIFLLEAEENKNRYVTVSALESLVSGEAQSYYEESRERYKILNDAAVREAHLRPYSVRPHLLFGGDIVEAGSEEFWINKAVQEYYRKDQVILDNQ